jgi:hypothetical protein
VVAVLNTSRFGEVLLFSCFKNLSQARVWNYEIHSHINHIVKEIDGTGENAILNYNDKAYIPLRAFAEAMGAGVTYEGPTSTSQGMHKIEILSTFGELPLIHYDSVNEMCSPINIGLEPPDEYHNDETFGELTIAKKNYFHFGFTNVSKDDISLEPVELAFEVYKVNTVNEREQLDLVYSYKLPTMSGLFPTHSGYGLSIPWNQKGLDGALISPGEYRVQLQIPDPVSYTVQGSEDRKSITISQGMGCNRNSFSANFK